jgi:prolipoprotein diacylglyceryl transferase
MHWNIDPIIASVGPIELRYYGLFFALGLLLAARAAPENFATYGLPREHAERLALWIPVGMLLGAHYFHLIFYQPEGLLDLPHFDADGHFVLGSLLGLGSGLASHGGAIGCVVALYVFWRRHGNPSSVPFHRYADAVMVTSVRVYPWVRLGNFFNSEIVGRPTNAPFGVVFDRFDDVPRHPVQLYEAVLYFAELALVLWAHRHYARRLRDGTMFYSVLGLHFALRFIAEFFKESQGIDEGWPFHLNMGHVLSAPVTIVCAILVLGTRRFAMFPLLAPPAEAQPATAAPGRPSARQKRA